MEKKSMLIVWVFIAVFLATEVMGADLTLTNKQLTGHYTSPTGGGIIAEGCTVTGTTVVLEASSRIILRNGFRATGSFFYAIIGLNQDNDQDSLLDWWELLNFHNLGQSSGSDFDLDGMPDGWEATYGLNPTVNDSASDLDGDGYSNYAEYVTGSAPNDPDSKPPGNGYYNQYDLLGRLKGTVYLPDNQVRYELQYEYDSVGNRTKETIR